MKQITEILSGFQPIFIGTNIGNWYCRHYVSLKSYHIGHHQIICALFLKLYALARITFLVLDENLMKSHESRWEWAFTTRPVLSELTIHNTSRFYIMH
jgi:hypothetical protein